MIYSLITGGTSGLGYELAKKLIKMGKNVIIMGRDEKKLNSSTKELKIISQEVKVIGVKIDISNLSEVDKFFLDLKTDNIEIEHLYNNAGQGFFGSVEEVTEYEISSILNSNLVGLINMTSRAVTHMKSLEQKCKIINILSTAAQIGKKNETIYCAAKWGAKGFLESVRDEIHGGNIEVIIVYPGGMNTPFWNDIDSGYEFLTFMKAEDVAEEIVHAAINHKILISDLVINRRK
ncbi:MULTISPECIES: SDR family NAD(P)-dependent oxidoreductase [Psychrilyobacter]|uniref:SDR family NAD(P)-dependent oxidoreductase n=1 Tax=Psychrilyobacter piezotolerans TaxID=2293438 RepID=A0ABX9KFJ2_9FUSO|nr:MULTISPECIES: SDR family NAD(P)-dependent oxidoreductase [Psychrilyobacter]MCS5421388.1 SDR family NAD(P)-dependent oxidoreductase [Psychrilyobacter sp. S5]NDI78474.1 SDR family NAD(P)-dependent oxidoreductase [Psychrilyobacter piezotolerans]RDE60659.1 SDR family NAD(P)-dependent oxidoreductase [Psychrilyobacter sp. S5]REI40586.1 SDR family NAD(P)-dependent oxidoreductase [Psychrilyobacter piezotolerans]